LFGALKAQVSGGIVATDMHPSQQTSGGGETAMLSMQHVAEELNTIVQ
jgi:hypothetical protein